MVAKKSRVRFASAVYCRVVSLPTVCLLSLDSDLGLHELRAEFSRDLGKQGQRVSVLRRGVDAAEAGLGSGRVVAGPEVARDRPAGVVLHARADVEDEL